MTSGTAPFHGPPATGAESHARQRAAMHRARMAAMAQEAEMTDPGADQLPQILAMAAEAETELEAGA